MASHRKVANSSPWVAGGVCGLPVNIDAFVMENDAHRPKNLLWAHSPLQKVALGSVLGTCRSR
eukprot:15473068-Alexandrium_andersonii.AAC.1